MVVEDDIEEETVPVEPVVVVGNEAWFAERIHDETEGKRAVPYCCCQETQWRLAMFTVSLGVDSACGDTR